MDDCLFCAIVDGRAEGSFVVEEDRVVAFLDILPVSTGHTLVVPRTHAVGLHDLDQDDGAAMMRLGQRIAAALRVDRLADGINLFLADGEVAGQEVFHAHLHVIPRFADDGMTLHVDYDQPPDRGALDALAGDLRNTLDGLTPR